MAELEETLNHILGDENAMGQIMALAQSLTGGQNTEEPTQPQTVSQEPPDLSALLGGVDPALLRLGTELLQTTQSRNRRTAALGEALKPFVRPERRDRLDRAVRLAEMIGLARAALRTVQEKGEGHV